MRNFRNWDIWNNGKHLVRLVYQLTEGFPTTEKFGLVSQLRRAAVSIPVNIAEGAGRNTEKDFRHFLHNSMGSAFEVETLLDLAIDLNFVTHSQSKEVDEVLTVLQKQLNTFITKLNHSK